MWPLDRSFPIDRHLDDAVAVAGSEDNKHSFCRQDKDIKQTRRFQSGQLILQAISPMLDVVS